MYQGGSVPGFPAHPHAGLETMTLLFEGTVDHSDSSSGFKARIGKGDFLWMNSGKGLIHSEMLPLINHEKPNPSEMIQLWLNLPKAKKRSNPFVSVAWYEDRAEKVCGEEIGKQAIVRVIAGNNFLGMQGMTPPPDSYATEARSEIVVATLNMQPGSKVRLPVASYAGINRTLYFYDGSGVMVESESLSEPLRVVQLQADREVEIKLKERSNPSSFFYRADR